MNKIIFILLLLVSSLFNMAVADTYKLDVSHSLIGFSVKHLGVFTVRGRFTGFDGMITTDKNKQLKSVDVNIDVDSVDTGDKNRDQHLKTADFFDLAKYPKVTFKFVQLIPQGENYVVKGKLKIKNVEKEVLLVGKFVEEVSDPWGKIRAGFVGETEIDRKDFGINFNKVMDKGGLVVGDMVKISIEIEAVKQ